MNPRKAAESKGQCKRDSNKAVGSNQVLTVVNIQLLVFKAVALCKLTEELHEWVWLLTTLLHSVAEACNCISPLKLLLLSTRIHSVISWKANFTKQNCGNINWTELGWGKQTSTNRILN